MIKFNNSVLVLGAAGFLGTVVVRQLLEAGCNVITSDKCGNVHIKGDLSDCDFVMSLPDVDVVINCAAVQYVTPSIPYFFRDDFFKKNNIDSAMHLAKRYANTGVHFIHIGTSMMYKQIGSDLDESPESMRGEGVYSRSKMKAQQYINSIPGSATVVPCIIGGPGRDGLFRSFVNMINKWGLVIYPGPGVHKIHTVHVEDVASLIILIAEKRASGFYNAAAPGVLSIREWVDEIRDQLGVKKVKIINLPLFFVSIIACLSRYRLLAREQLLMLKIRHVLSTERALQLGWTPQYSCSKIVRDIASHIAEKK